ncbi:TLR cluster1 member 2 [Biomphalaria glabrata]
MATFLKVLAFLICTILGHQCSDITSDSTNITGDSTNDTLYEGDLVRESILSRRKGTFEQNKNVHREERSKNVILRDKNMSVSDDSVCKIHELTVDCSKRLLKEINSSWFPDSTDVIFLNDNLLTRLANLTFSHLIHLTYLDLSNNEISQIDLLAFDGLTSLRYLSLRYNVISFKAVSPNILKPLNNLQQLDLIQQPIAEKCDVPIWIFQSLNLLRSLAVGTNSSILYFGSEFLNFKNLATLEITGSTQYVTEASFKNVNKLKELVIRDMLIKYVDDKVFVQLKSLTVLKMHFVVIDLQRVLALLWPFTGREMSLILFQGITTTLAIPDPTKNGFLTKKDFMYLTDICLNTFTMIECNIYYITADAFRNRTTWDRCLRNVYISGNPLIGSTVALFPLALLQNLTTAVVGNALRSCQSFSPFPNVNFKENYFFQNISLVGLSDFQRKFEKDFKANKYLREKNNKGNLTFDTLDGIIYIYVSKNLLSWVSQRLLPDVTLQQDITFRGADNMQYLDISDSGFHTFTGHIRGLSSVKTAIISGNDVSFLSEYFLDPFSGLENLVVSKYFSNNIITTLPAETTKALDFLHEKNGGFELKLSGNILSCGCRDLPFLHWLNSTLVRLDNNRNYTRMSKDGERTNTLAFSDLESLWRECWGEFFFYIAIITLCLYVIGVVLIFLMLKNKTFLVSYFLQLFGNFKLHTRLDYKTDVYIGYSDEDYRFPCMELREHLERNLRLSTFILDRDLLASLDKASGIVDAINSCWRILLVCSKSFLKDEAWSMFTMRSAMYAQSPDNPARIVIIVHKSCLSLLPKELLSVVNDENIIIVPEWKINYTMSENLRTRLSA